MSDAAWPSSPSFHYNTLHNKVLHSTCQWPLDGFSNPDFELSSDSEPTPKDGTTLTCYNLEPAPAKILYVLDHDSEVEMTIEDDCQFESVFEPEELPYDNIDIDLPNMDMQVDSANTSPLANEISNTDPEIHWQDGKRQGYCIVRRANHLCTSSTGIVHLLPVKKWHRRRGKRLERRGSPSRTVLHHQNVPAILHCINIDHRDRYNILLIVCNDAPVITLSIYQSLESIQHSLATP
jgi:hypothetical protein